MHASLMLTVALLPDHWTIDVLVLNFLRKMFISFLGVLKMYISYGWPRDLVLSRSSMRCIYFKNNAVIFSFYQRYFHWFRATVHNIPRLKVRVCQICKVPCSFIPHKGHSAVSLRSNFSINFCIRHILNRFHALHFLEYVMYFVYSWRCSVLRSLFD